VVVGDDANGHHDGFAIACFHRNPDHNRLGDLNVGNHDRHTAKAAENRLRRKAERQGLTLRKSARRDPDATDYGRWSLHNAATGKVVLQGTLQDVEQYLTGR
jgi:hypothetical protein